MIATSKNHIQGELVHCSTCGKLQSTNDFGRYYRGLCSSCSAWDELLEAVSHQPPDLWASGAILPDLEATTSHQAITEIVDALTAQTELSEQISESLVKAFVFDQEVASRAVDHGLAMLHVTHPSVDAPVASVARSQLGIDFGAADGQPAKVFMLLVSPPQPPAEHLRLSAAAARLLRNYGRQSTVK